MDRAAAAEGLWDRVVALVAGLSAHDWSRATPCAGWDVRDLVGHLSGLQVAFDTGRVEPPPRHAAPQPGLAALDVRTNAGVIARRGWSREELLAELATARAGHVRRLAAVASWDAPTVGPLGGTREDGLFRVRMFDLWVHLQDLRMALGQPVEADDDSPAAAVAHGYVWERVPFLLGKRVGAPEGSTLRLTFSAPLDVDTVVEVRGGRARLNPEADAGICVVAGAPAGLTMLACGRATPEHWRSERMLHWRGSLAEAFVARARLFETPSADRAS